jgi:hypothetical protein
VAIDIKMKILDEIQRLIEVAPDAAEIAVDAPKLDEAIPSNIWLATEMNRIALAEMAKRPTIEAITVRLEGGFGSLRFERDGSCTAEGNFVGPPNPPLN